MYLIYTIFSEIAEMTLDGHQQLPVFHSNLRLISAKETLWFVVHTERSLSLSVLMATFPGRTGYAGIRISLFWILLELRMMEEVVATGTIRCAQLQSNCHHQQTNTQLSTGHILFLSPNQQCQSTGEKLVWRICM